MGLDGWFSEHQAIRDLPVRHAPRDEAEDLDLAFSQFAQALMPRCVGRRRQAVADTVEQPARHGRGQQSSPAATTRIAWTKSVGVTSLSRKPLAPARSASIT